MNEKEKKILLITSLICASPLLLSVALYGRLPDEIAVHWNSAGEADGFMNKFPAAFGLPILFLLAHLVTRAALESDPKKWAHPHGLKALSTWLIPPISVLSTPCVLLIAMGVDIPIVLLIRLLIGVLLIVCGSYLPTGTRNSTIGIKLPWILASDENWDKTHRLAGVLFTAYGFLYLISTCLTLETPGYFLPATIAAIALLVLLPCVYSFWLHRRQQRAPHR